MSHPLRCRCGNIRGEVRDASRSNRGICYCRDCQAFASFLDKTSDTLDPQGGTQIIQTIQANVTFFQGSEHLVCIRLTQDGLLRWYASCCRTPIGNTPADHRISFVGLIHTCLQSPAVSIDESFGPVRMWVNTSGATGPAPVPTRGMVAGIWRFLRMVIWARINGDYKRSAFFKSFSKAGTALPIAAVRVLNSKDTPVR